MVGRECANCFQAHDDGVCVREALGGSGGCSGGCGFVQEGECVSEPLVAPQEVDGFVLGNAREPRGGVVGDALKPPMVKSREQGFLHDVIGKVE